MKTATPALVACLALSFASCSSDQRKPADQKKPGDLVVGKWRAMDGSGDTAQFSKEGAFMYVTKRGLFGAKYKINDKSDLDLTWEESSSQAIGDFLHTPGPITSFQTIKVTTDRLNMVTPLGSGKTFERTE